MSWWLSQSLVVLSLLSAATAFVVISLGQCPVVPAQENFDVNRYMGKWWEYERFPAPFEFNGVCGFANYTLLNPTTVKVVNSGIQEIRFLWWTWRKPLLAVGSAVILNQNEPSKLLVNFPGSPGADATEPNYFLVETDYDNYAVVFSCTGDSLGFGNIQFAWILTREQGVRPANLEAIHDNLTDRGVNVRNFITVKHNKCPKENQ